MVAKKLLELLKSVEKEKLKDNLKIIFDSEQSTDERYAAAMRVTEKQARLIYSRPELIRWIHNNIDPLPIKVAAVLGFKLSNAHRNQEGVGIASSLGGNVGEGGYKWRGNFAPRDRMILT